MRYFFLIAFGVLAIALGVVAWHHFGDNHDRKMAEKDAAVETLVMKAVDAYEAGGMDALGPMSNPANSHWYDDGDLYVFAWDTIRRQMVVHGGQPERVGQLIDDPIDPLPFRARALSILYQASEEPDGVWVHYAHINPLSDDHSQRYRVKRAYIVTSGDVVFGVGRYMKGRH